MAYTEVASVLCGRGQLTTVLNGLLGNRAYVIQNNPVPFPNVQYRGTIFQELDDTLVSNIPFELISSTQMYRPYTRISTIGYGGSNVGVLKVWLPNNYRFSTAIIVVYLVS